MILSVKNINVFIDRAHWISPYKYTHLRYIIKAFQNTGDHEKILEGNNKKKPSHTKILESNDTLDVSTIILQGRYGMMLSEF